MSSAEAWDASSGAGWGLSWRSGMVMSLPEAVDLTMLTMAPAMLRATASKYLAPVLGLGALIAW